MACRVVPLPLQPGSTGAIVCGPRERSKPCRYCGRRGGRLCDWLEDAGGKTCDVPMCEECTVSPMKDVDYCREHDALRDAVLEKFGMAPAPGEKTLDAVRALGLDPATWLPLSPAAKLHALAEALKLAPPLPPPAQKRSRRRA